MDFRDAWLYSDFIHPNMRVPLVHKGISVEKFKEIVAGWRQLATMYRIKTVGRDRVLDELVRRGKITEREVRELRKKHVREAAKEEKFDLDATQKRFMKK